MASSPDPTQDKKEHPSTYIVQDRSNQEEAIRVDEQDHMFTASMGGVLPEQSDLTLFQKVIDVGCASGGWLIELAKTCPGATQLVGVDVSTPMIERARKRAEAEQLSDRVHFQTGDALRMLEFPSNTFDLVNQRFGMSFLRKWDWPKILNEYQRVCKPGKVIRITETMIPESNSPMLTKLMDMLFQAMFQAGYVFSQEPDGVFHHLPAMMTQYGIEQVQTRTYVIAFHTDPKTRQDYVQDLIRLFRTTIPLLRKWSKVPANYDDLYQQMVQEIQQPDFEVRQNVLTAWGTARTTKRHQFR